MRGEETSATSALALPEARREWAEAVVDTAERNQRLGVHDHTQDQRALNQSLLLRHPNLPSPGELG